MSRLPDVNHHVDHYNISQSGRPVVLFGGGSPYEFERLHRRKYFSTIHYLALTCDPSVLENRLLARPAWRSAFRPEFIKAQTDWNQWFINKNNEKMPYHRIRGLIQLKKQKRNVLER